MKGRSSSMRDGSDVQVYIASFVSHIGRDGCGRVFTLRWLGVLNPLTLTA